MLYKYTCEERERNIVLKVIQPETNRVVFLRQYPSFYEEAITGYLIEDGTLVSYGLMKDFNDVEGLAQYLRQCGIIGEGDAIELAVYKDGGQCGCGYEKGGLVEMSFEADRVIYNGKDVGLIKTTRLSDRTIEIDKLYLNKDQRQKGIGRKVLDKIFVDNPDVNEIKVYPLASSEPYWFRFAKRSDKDGNAFITRESFKKGLNYKSRYAEGGILDYEPSSYLSKEHQAIERKFGHQLFDDYEAEKREYLRRFGKVINTDNARELSEDYRKNKQELSSAVHEPASAFVKRLYADLLKDKPESGYVLFTAGGTGSGKTTAINKLPATKYLSDNADMVYDSNMNNTPSAVKKIEQALLSGRRAVVIFVYRDAVEAFENGVIPRSTRSGRTVPIYEHVNTHIGSVVSIGELMEKYRNNSQVVFEIIDNSYGKDRAKQTTFATIKRKAYLGAEELKKQLYAINEEQRIRGKISQAQYNGFSQGKEGNQVFEQGGSTPIADEGAWRLCGQNNGDEFEQSGSSRQKQLVAFDDASFVTMAAPEIRDFFCTADNSVSVNNDLSIDREGVRYLPQLMWITLQNFTPSVSISYNSDDEEKEAGHILFDSTGTPAAFIYTFPNWGIIDDYQRAFNVGGDVVMQDKILDGSVGISDQTTVMNG